MKSKVLITFIVLLSLFLGLYAQVPRTMNYQGKITDDGGVGLHGTFTIQFRIFNLETGGLPLWFENRSVNIVNGLFDIQLGTVSPIDLDFSEPYWIELSISSDGGATWETFEPRERLASVSYAFRSLSADNSTYTENAVQSVSSSENRTGRIGHMMFIPTESSSITESVSEDTIYIAISGTGSGASTTLEEISNVQILASDQGDILYFDGENWVDLDPGTAGQLLSTGGVGTNPSWTDVSMALNDLTDVSSEAAATGDILYYDGAEWVKLPPGAAGQVLKSTGASSAPTWGDDAGADEDWLIDGDLVYNDTKSVKVGASPIPGSALFEVESSDKGVLIPRTVPSAIPDPVTGLFIYNIDCNAFNYYDGSEWKVFPDFVTGTISGASEICYPDEGYVYSIPEIADATYSWTVPSGASIVGAADGHSISVNYGGSSSSGDLCVTVTSPCGSSSRCMYVNTFGGSVGGSVSGGGTVCEDTGPVTLTLTGHTGSIRKWQKSVDGGIFWSDIAHTESTYGASTTSEGSTIYRAVVESGHCGVEYSSTATVVVNPGSVGGSLTRYPTGTLCVDGDVTLTVSGHEGSVTRWEKQVDSGGWTNISSTSETLNDTPGSSGNWEYRVQIQNGSCAPAYSDIESFSVSAGVVGGTVTGDDVVVVGTSTTLTLGGTTSSVQRWQKSLDGGDWIDIIDTSPTLVDIPDATGEWEYRAVLFNGTCYGVSGSHTITVVNGMMTFNYTASNQTFTVPAGITEVTIECWGAQGQNGATREGTTALGGLGGYVKGIFATSPGEDLLIKVGGSGASGGWNGGGAPGQGGCKGGGSSDVRQGGTGTADRIIVAAGGGGAGGSYSGAPRALGGDGGDGGANTGESGTAGDRYTVHPGTPGYGGGGGSQSSGGSGGSLDGASGGLLGGGTGATCPYYGGLGVGGGGGGGGYYGGGGGGYPAGYASGLSGGGGGGGSNYIHPGATSTTNTRGVRSDHGLVKIIW